MTKGIENQDLTRIMTTRYTNYALSVVTGRALPDVRDGLKPVQRRILYTMFEDLKLLPPKKHRKSAAIVGTTLALYQCSGDSSIYDAMVRMAQPWVMNLPLVDGYGNFGSLDGDPPAASRYTEARLQEITATLFGDLKYPVVDMKPNYDSSTQEPLVLPVSAPLVLVNGCSGIAVGMATSIPPHHLGEVLDACEALLKNPSLSIKDLLTYIPAPDFPTGGLLLADEAEIEEMYTTGQGSVAIRAKWHVETENKKTCIVVTEIPYGVKKQDLVEKLAATVVKGEVPQIKDLRDSSGKDVRIVIDITKEEHAEDIMAYLFKNSMLETKFHLNLTCLVPYKENQVAPQRLSLKEILTHYLDFRKDVFKKKIEYKKDILERRILILEGFISILPKIQEVVEIVVKAKSKSEARDFLMQAFSLVEEQADWILNSKVYSLSRHEADSLLKELEGKKKEANTYSDILASEQSLKKSLLKEIRDFRKTVQNPRRTVIVEKDSCVQNFDPSLFIEEEDVFCIVSNNGWIRRQKSYTDIQSLRVKDNDTIGWVVSSTTKDFITFFTNKGKSYCMRVNDIVDTTGYGNPVQSVFSFEDGERIVECFAMDSEGFEGILVCATKRGKMLRISSDGFFEASRASGRTFMKLGKGDEVLGVEIAKAEDDKHCVCITRQGRKLSFPFGEVSIKSSPTQGEKAMILSNTDEIIAFGLTEGARGNSLRVFTDNATNYDIRHTSFGGSSRKGRLGKLILKRDNFVLWVRPTKETRTLRND